MSGRRTANLSNDTAVRALRWREGDPRRFYVRDNSGRPGLYMRISRTGDRLWLYRYKRNGTQRWVPLGQYPDLSVEEALVDYAKIRAAVRAGKDPGAEREAEREEEAAMRASDSFTLARLFEDHYLPRYAKPRKRSWKAEKDRFERHIRPVLGDKPAASITATDLEKLLEPLADKKYHEARKLRALLSKVYSWARDNRSAVKPGDGALLACTNPCADYRLPDPPAPAAQRQRVLKADEIRTIWEALPNTSAGRALRVQLLTGCRISEVCGMTESELDREAKEWIIPGARTKNGRDHVVPLTAWTLKLIGKKGARHCFPAKSKAGHVTASGAYQALRRVADAAKIKGVGTHTLRRTFTTYLARLEVSREVRDRLTNHADPTVDGRHYNRHDYLPEKRRALEQWETTLRAILEPSEKVVPLRKGAES